MEREKEGEEVTEHEAREKRLLTCSRLKGKLKGDEGGELRKKNIESHPVLALTSFPFVPTSQSFFRLRFFSLNAFARHEFYAGAVAYF